MLLADPTDVDLPYKLFLISYTLVCVNGMIKSIVAVADSASEGRRDPSPNPH